MSEPVRKPVLTIPCETEDSGAFKTRLSTLIGSPGTHLYVDTSFLMWMTKIGSVSRRELLDWLGTHCAGRVHVPIWAAHEYVKHHVAGTIITELSEKTDEVSTIVGKTYNYFRPFMDEAHGEGAEDPSTLRAATRSALNALHHLTTVTRQWHKSYQKHASEVIAFINVNTPEKTSLYEYFKDLPGLGAGRFVGSIPPGFQDRRKKGSASSPKGEDDEAPADSNRYGDLVFWKELLEHAKGANAQAIIVLTNDRKNDWHFGRSDTVQIEPALLALKKSWKPVPRAHPMLVMEARLLAEIEELELLDSPYLAALLRDIAEEGVRSFADVAIIPDGPEPEDEDERRAKLIEVRHAADLAKAAAQAAENGHLFADAPEVGSSATALRRALLESRRAVAKRGVALLAEWRATAEAKQSIKESLTQAKLDGLDHKELVRIARELHDRVLREEAGYGEALADLVSILHSLPPNTAGCFYLGFLASMYLERETNTSLVPPRSPSAQQLFACQSAAFAVNAINAVARRLSDNDVAPLYIPSADPASVAVSLDTEVNTPGLDELRSLRVAGVELLTAAQADERLRLAALFDATKPVDGDAIVRKACELFSIPSEQVERTEAFAITYALTETIGFKRPVDVSIPKEKTLGD
ncbi:PIN-like domain-containing protein [Mesorhizobium sp. PL10]